MSSELPSQFDPIVATDLSVYRSDWWALGLLADRRGDPFPSPRAAVIPRSTSEVAEVVSWASGEGIPVVARGGGSGVCGGAVPGESAIVIDLSALDSIGSIDPVSLVVTAEAGVRGPQLEEALAHEGMTLGHVPQSFDLSTLGGWISTKATGQLSTRYGGIEDRLLGLTGVLADGTVVSSKASPRASAGPDWWRMFVGSEGTAGIVTEATLACHPVPESHRWIGTAVESFESGLDLLRRLVHSGLRPSVARLYDQADAALNFGRLGIADPVVILRFEGSPVLVDAEVSVAKVMVGGLPDVGPGPGEHWWGHRFRAVDAYRRLLAGEGALGSLGVVDTMEVAGFWSRLPDLYRSVSKALSGHADGVLAHASHLYMSGANIYFTFLISSAEDEVDAERRYRACWDAGMRATLEAGGTISHHHGIGMLKTRWMREELGSGILVVEKLKHALDPEGIMNPGKVLPG